MDPHTPTSIDKYEIASVLGSGATSTVYLAYDAFTERKVAIKVFNSSLLTDPEYGRTYLKLIANEASLVGRLDHPHIVGIYDAVLNQDKCYIVMEYVQGETLEKYGQPEFLLPIEKVVEIIFKCALALDFASRNGVVHRDIKPANIMLCQNGDVKITDFGAAVLTRSDKTELVGVGSPAYMSPEQIRLDSLTQQTDIYSLGVMMYRLLTGRMPFEAENSYILTRKILNEEPPHIRNLRPALPLRLDNIVTKAMHKKREERYLKWRDFAKDLAEIATLDLPQETVSDTEKFNMMRNLSFFCDFGDIELWEVLRISLWGRIPAGTHLVNEGDEGDFFFIIAEGEVKVTKGGKTLGLQGAGECFGEMCYIQKGSTTRTATVIANTPVILLKIKPDFLRNASENCQLKFNSAFLNALVDRLTRANIELAGKEIITIEQDPLSKLAQVYSTEYWSLVKCIKKIATTLIDGMNKPGYPAVCEPIFQKYERYEAMLVSLETAIDEVCSLHGIDPIAIRKIAGDKLYKISRLDLPPDVDHLNYLRQFYSDIVCD